jgi:hypothetical protein
MSFFRQLRGGAALILIALTGCDNVRWGGADIAVVSPPPRAPADAQVTGDDGDPVLYHVQRSEQGAIMRPIAEIGSDSLVPVRPAADPTSFGNRFIAEHMRQGAEFVLFSNGVRVGTLVVESATLPSAATCPAVPQAGGVLELAQEAGEITELLALSRLEAPQVQRRLGEPTQPTRNMQVIAPILAERVMRARRAPLAANWQRAMQQLKPFPYGTSGQMAFAATFLVGDELGPGGDDQGHSTFMIGAPVQASFDTAYVHFTRYEDSGKRAPRVVDFLDWNRSGHVELLLEVFSVNERWFEALGRDGNGRWRTIFNGRCPGATAEPPAPATPPNGAAP